VVVRTGEAWCRVVMVLGRGGHRSVAGARLVALRVFFFFFLGEGGGGGGGCVCLFGAGPCWAWRYVGGGELVKSGLACG
jgi:hypothetical protein